MEAREVPALKRARRQESAESLSDTRAKDRRSDAPSGGDDQASVAEKRRPHEECGTDAARAENGSDARRNDRADEVPAEDERDMEREDEGSRDDADSDLVDTLLLNSGHLNDVVGVTLPQTLDFSLEALAAGADLVTEATFVGGAATRSPIDAHASISPDALTGVLSMPLMGAQPGEALSTAGSSAQSIEVSGAHSTLTATATASRDASERAWTNLGVDESANGVAPQDSTTKPVHGALNASEANARLEASAARATDPLGNLAQAMQDSQRVGATPSSQQGSAIAGRLAEVEAQIARSRATQAIAASGTRMTDAVVENSASDLVAASGGTRAADAERFAMAEGNAAVGSNAASPGASALTNAAAGQSAIRDLNLDTAVPSSQFLAADLAAVTSDDASPGAQLAAKGAELLAKHRGGAITMRLEPPALGQLKIELRITQGAVVADFTTATPEARMLLESNLGMLRERLESQGLSIDRLSVHGMRSSAETSAASASGASQQDARSHGDTRGDTRGDARNENGGTRQDAAGGESRGRRESDERAQDQHARRQSNSSGHDELLSPSTKRGFAGALADAGRQNVAAGTGLGKTQNRTEDSVRRAG